MTICQVCHNKTQPTPCPACNPDASMINNKYNPQHPDCYSAWLRIEYAKAALTGLLPATDYKFTGRPIKDERLKELTDDAFHIADAMIAASEKKQ